METTNVEMSRTAARELWRDYRKHLHWSQPIDQEIAKAYQAIAQGKVVIKALDSIRLAGLGPDGLPKLAIVRADAAICTCEVHYNNGAATFSMDEPWRRAYPRRAVSLPQGTFPNAGWKRGRAIVPLIPIQHRPRRGLENYHILWEADWKEVPVDPMLLRRVGKGDLWIVLAAWDLTEIERAALQARVAR